MIIFKETVENFIKVIHLSDKSNQPFIYPTDTIYGIGACYLNEEANNKIYEIKKRDKGKTFITLIGSEKQLYELIDRKFFTNEHEKIIHKFWPGPFTFIFYANKRLPEYLVQNGKIAVRMPSRKVLTEAIRFSQPITSTSVNISDESSLTNLSDIYNFFSKDLKYAIAGNTNSNVPSTIIDISELKNIKVLRNPKNINFEELI
ncbi:L-threonylcarbamoyladenylate synthase [Deferribacter thermophilus]|uniref:L-threonylcarbamoyladenylate synthase n=1 Tax=Deferribacter thermophilus TaxID=53573 RepID=UPI003C23BA0A